MVYNFNTPLSIMNRTAKLNISKEIMNLDNIKSQIDLTSICRTHYIQQEQNTFFSGAHGTLPWIDHMLVHKASLNKF